MASALRDGSSCHESCEAVATSEPLCLAETTSAILVGQMDQRIHLAKSVDNETETSGLKSENHIAESRFNRQISKISWIVVVFITIYSYEFTIQPVCHVQNH